MEKTKVAIVGLGTIGTGVARLLLDHGDRTARHAGRTLWLEEIVDRDVSRPRDVDLPSGILSNDLARITKNPEIKVVAKLIGGLEPARTIMLELLRSGKDVVTANKALLAEHGAELFDAARELGRSIAFEASVAGGIPIIANISQCLSANQILSLRGILNGTSNFIVTKMEEGMDYAGGGGRGAAAGLCGSQSGDGRGRHRCRAEAGDPGPPGVWRRVHWRDIPRQGIDTLNPADLRYARELGYRIKLLAVAELTGGVLELHVAPTLVRMGWPLAEVREAYNAISVVGDAVGPVFFHGLGAGQMPTASAVVADMIDTAVGRTAITFKTLELWSQREARVDIRDHAHLKGRFYLRFVVQDHPGVMAQIAGVLGAHNVSIASIIQHEPDPDSDGSVVPLVIMTHMTTEGATRTAVEEIDRLPCVLRDSVRMRVLD